MELLSLRGSMDGQGSYYKGDQGLGPAGKFFVTGLTLIGNVIIPLDGHSASSYAFIVILLEASMSFSVYPRPMTTLKVQILRPAPPSIKTHRILQLWTKTSRCKGSL